MIKLGYTILYVKDVEKAISFYEKAFGFSRKFITPESDYAELATGETTLSFANIPLSESNLSEGFVQSNLAQKPFGIEIAFTTDDVAQTYQDAIKAGGIPLEAPSEKPHGQTVAYLRDFDGFLVEICSPMSN